MASVTKRTSKQIEADYMRIKEAAKTAKSWSEIENITGLSRIQISTSLKRHPIINKRIQEQLLNNKNIEDVSSATHEETVPEIIEEVHENHPDTFETKNNSKAYVIDASITETADLRERLKQVCDTNGTIILTSITIKELAKLQKFSDAAGYDARFILNLAIERPDVFKSVLIDENVGIPDDCIVHYCNQNRDKVILWDSDKEMTLKARMYSIEEEYFKKAVPAEQKATEEKIQKPSKNFQAVCESTYIPPQKVVKKITTPVVEVPIRVSPFNATKNQNNRLVINNFEEPLKSICVYSRGELYCKGPYTLRVGDSVMVATLEENNVIDFKVYLVISTNAIDEYKLQFHKKFYPDKRIYISEGRYRNFIYAAKKKFNV